MINIINKIDAFLNESVIRNAFDDIINQQQQGEDVAVDALMDQIMRDVDQEIDSIKAVYGSTKARELLNLNKQFKKEMSRLEGDILNKKLAEKAEKTYLKIVKKLGDI